MEKLIGIISEYNIFNYLFTGVVLCVYFGYLFELPALEESLFSMTFVCYFIGMIVSRIGSVALEDILLKGITRIPKTIYVAAEKKDGHIRVLQQEANVFRTIVAASIVAIIVTIVNQLFHYKAHSCGEFIILTGAMLGLAALFTISYRKQTRHILSRAKA